MKAEDDLPIFNLLYLAVPAYIIKSTAFLSAT